MNGFIRNFKPLEILTEEQIEAIHQGTLEVLWVTGVRVEHGKALKLFEQNGCKVDHNELMVRIPPVLAEECLRMAPGKFQVKARDSKNDLMLGGNTIYFGAADGMKTVDIETWEPRVPTRKENYAAVTILDALPELHFLPPLTPYFGFEGVPSCMASPESLASRLRNSTKCVCTNSNNNSDVFDIEMAQALGIELLGSGLISPPLTISGPSVEADFRFAEADFPIRICSGPIMGATTPVTIAGSTIIHNAEIIAQVVLTQLIKPGIRLAVKDFIFPVSMRTGAPVFGTVETVLHNAVFHQMFQKYDIPRASTNSYPSAKLPDYQCGYEKATSILSAAVSGANYTEPYGGVHGELTHHPLQSILDNDLAGMIGRYIEGVTVNNETMAIDLIQEVGPIPGHFLGKKHTRNWWKQEWFVPEVADRLTYPEWLVTGKKTCIDYAREKMENILATHNPTPLTPSQEQDVERILEEAREYYKTRGMISKEEMATYRKSMKAADYPYE
jgi:trimethylamine--corrinoid protein Co-methyltransferase